MDDRMRREVVEFTAGLAEREQERLAAAGTFVDIEELTAETSYSLIGRRPALASLWPVDWGVRSART